MSGDLTCDLCYTKDFKSYRYKCLNCEDLDLCSFCFECHLEFESHKMDHLMVKFDSVNSFCGFTIEKNTQVNLEFIKDKFKGKKHDEICNACGYRIHGVNLKCDICFRYYQCLNCFQSGKSTDNHVHGYHPMIVFNRLPQELELKSIEIIEKIGEGGFGTVWLARQNNQKNFALKIFDMTGNEDKYIYLFKSYLRELDAYNEISGQNILRMIGNTIKYDERKSYIATEYMEKGSLKDVINNDEDFGLCERYKVALGIICGIIRIHEKGLVHRDIRPDNVLIDYDFTAKIADYGIAKIARQNKTNTDVAFMPYMPPEFYSYMGAATKPKKSDLQKIDIFTYGLTLLEIFNGKHGKKKEGEAYMFRNPIVVKIPSEYFKELVDKCIEHKVAARPIPIIIFNYLNKIHSFFQFVCKEEKRSLGSFSFDEREDLFKKTYELFNDEFKLNSEM